MKKENRSALPDILPVCRSKAEAKQYYDRISKVYDYLAGVFERKYAGIALNKLSIEEGEIVLEIGFGTGHCLKRIAESVGEAGKVYGVDISSGMLEVARKRLGKARLMKRAELYCGDAAVLPYDDGIFDAVFMSFTLELFDTAEIPAVLKEVNRVLKPGGRTGIAAMSRENENSLMLRLYEWAHKKWPSYADCRPIYLERSLTGAGYDIRDREMLKLSGLPVEIVIANKKTGV
jgi:demethylmenaquinone methyltransferase/2-methoxy-6-polyprenyl-1,4-benzoquinol methylase